jgi:ribosome-binding protein aMBF1 (putative translation factor)
MNETTDGRGRGSRGSDFRDDLRRRLEDPELAADYKAALERASLGLKIARLRAQRGLSQAELASRLNTSQSVVSRYESADYTNYNLETLRRLASALGAELSVDFTESAEAGESTTTKQRLSSSEPTGR